MSQFFLLCLILVNALAAMASENAETKLRSSLADQRNPPAPAPYKAEAQAPIIRKLGKHQPRVVKTYGYGSSPASSPSQVHQPEEKMHPTGEGTSSYHSAAIVEANNGEHASVEGMAIHLEKPHHSFDKSIAGGGVILGGLATTFLVAVFCYIRATGRHKSESRTHQNNTEITN